MRLATVLAACSALGAFVAMAAPPGKAVQKTDAVLKEAVMRRDVRGVESRLASGGDPRAREAGQRTLLMEAVSTGDAEIVRALLRGGADASAATASGWTAVHEAVAGRKSDLLREVLQAGAAPDAVDRGVGTALDVAERNGLVEAARMLREHGAKGSGKSIGDTVCVRPWSGEGYCGGVLERTGPTYRIRVDEILGCRNGCTGNAVCSAGFALGQTVEVPDACLTHTGVAPNGGRQ